MEGRGSLLKYVRMGADYRMNRGQDGQQPPVGRGDASAIPEHMRGQSIPRTRCLACSIHQRDQTSQLESKGYPVCTFQVTTQVFRLKVTTQAED